MIFIYFQKNNTKCKIFNISIIILVSIYINILIISKNNALDPNYLKNKKFEKSYSKSFIETFFENPISLIRKFRELNYKNSLLENHNFKKMKIQMFLLL